MWDAALLQRTDREIKREAFDRVGRFHAVPSAAGADASRRRPLRFVRARLGIIGGAPCTLKFGVIRERAETREHRVSRTSSASTIELSPNFGDGVKDQAAAWA